MAIQKREFVMETPEWCGRVQVTADVYRDGIGWYEYWGAKCYDQGEWVVEVEEIEPIWGLDDDYTRQKQILSYIEENFDRLATYYSEEWSTDEYEAEHDYDN